LAFVATKADLVSKEDRSRLEDLLREMTSDFVDKLEITKFGLSLKHIACSAVLCAESRPDGAIKAAWAHDPSIVDDIRPSRVPEKWPNSWKNGEFRFPAIAPKFPENITIPPEHLKMDTLLDYLLKVI
jgi:predicted YcjX-like family ATPase